MTEKIKMIGFDLDGTLLTSQKKLTDYTREVLTKAIAEGIVVLPVTGRPLCGLPKEVIGIPGIRYAVTVNGARIVEIQGEKTIYSNLLSPEKSKEVLKILCEYDDIPEIYYNGIGYAEKSKLERINYYMKDPAMAEYMYKTRRRVDNIWDAYKPEQGGTDKVQGFFVDKQEQQEAWMRIEQLGGVAVTGALDTNIEVNAKGVCKGKCLLKLADMLGIQREEVMVFGDGGNDLTMIQEAGIGVAMANAIPSIKNAADIITSSNDEDGVAKAIEQYVFN